MSTLPPHNSFAQVLGSVLAYARLLADGVDLPPKIFHTAQHGDISAEIKDGYVMLSGQRCSGQPRFVCHGAHSAESPRRNPAWITHAMDADLRAADGKAPSQNPEADTAEAKRLAVLRASAPPDSKHSQSAVPPPPPLALNSAQPYNAQGHASVPPPPAHNSHAPYAQSGAPPAHVPPGGHGPPPPNRTPYGATAHQSSASNSSSGLDARPPLDFKALPSLADAQRYQAGPLLPKMHYTLFTDGKVPSGDYATAKYSLREVLHGVANLTAKRILPEPHTTTFARMYGYVAASQQEPFVNEYCYHLLTTAQGVKPELWDPRQSAVACGRAQHNAKHSYKPDDWLLTVRVISNALLRAAGIHARLV